MNLKILEKSLWVVSALLVCNCVRLAVDLKPSNDADIKIDPKRVIPVTTVIHAPKECEKKPITIAVIDSGYGYGSWEHKAKLCKFGHKTFTKNEDVLEGAKTEVPVPKDNHQHGTNILGVISSQLEKAKIEYCFVIVKYFNTESSPDNTRETFASALQYVANIRPDVVNISGGGYGYGYGEYISTRSLLDNGSKVIAAAGNGNGKGSVYDIDRQPYYPAMYDGRVVVVGNLDRDGKRSKTSNYGKSVTRWEVGVDVTGENITMSGTSQATAVATGKIVSQMKNKCK